MTADEDGGGRLETHTDLLGVPPGFVLVHPLPWTIDEDDGRRVQYVAFDSVASDQIKRLIPQALWQLELGGSATSFAAGLLGRWRRLGIAGLQGSSLDPVCNSCPVLRFFPHLLSTRREFSGWLLKLVVPARRQKLHRSRGRLGMPNALNNDLGKSEASAHGWKLGEMKGRAAWFHKHGGDEWSRSQGCVRCAYTYRSSKCEVLRGIRMPRDPLLRPLCLRRTAAASVLLRSGLPHKQCIWCAQNRGH